RYFVCDAAYQLGLFGWVANRMDGTVEVHAETDDSAKLRNFQALLTTGPRYASVDEVESREVEQQGCISFRITR
ncbi:MAG: acylphosphatase, partial [Acidobacteria bacterium]